MKLNLHYTEPRLVALYDIENPHGNDTDFFIQLAADLNAKTILDFGCGTGLLTRALVNHDRRIIGVDPSPAMLAYAKQQPGADFVEWTEGDSSVLGTPAADLVLMTSHVAQVFLDDSEWNSTLDSIHAALRPEGYLAFESRNPLAKAWESWNRETTYHRIDSPYGPVTSWLEVASVKQDRVCFEGHNLFEETGEVLVAESELRFRSLKEITVSLNRTGFDVQHVYGNWAHCPFTSESKVMVFVAQRS